MKNMYILFLFTTIIISCKKDTPQTITDPTAAVVVSPFSLVTIGTQRSETFQAVARCSSGGFALAGYDEDSILSHNSVYLARTDQNGVVFWKKELFDSASAITNSILETPDHGFLIVASTQTTVHNRGIVVLKLDQNGNRLWRRFYQNMISANGNNKIVSNGDSTYTIAGFNAPTWPQADIYLLKINSNGDSIWSKTIPLPDEEVTNSLILTQDQGYAMTGQTSVNSLSRYMFVVKTDKSGNVLWETKFSQGYGYGISALAYSIIQNANGDLLSVGSANTPNQGSAYVTRSDMNGGGTWAQVYPYGTGAIGTNDNAKCVSLMLDGNYLVTANYSTNSQGGTFLIKMNPNGVVIWRRIVSGLNADKAYEITAGEITMFGSTLQYGAGSFDMFLAKIHY